MSNIKTLEKTTSEQDRDIVEQPEPSCPLVDKALKEIEDACRRIKQNGREDESELRDMLSDVESNLAELSGYRRAGLLEDIRQKNIEIRHWGEEWKRYALRLEAQIERLEPTSNPVTPSEPTNSPNPPS